MNMIQPQEGETMAEAMLRMAKEQVKNPTTPEPAPPVEKPKKSSSKSPPKSPRGNGTPSLQASALGGDPNEGKGIEDMVYSAIHVYQRPGEQDGKTRWNAKHERDMNGPGTVVFCHLHPFGGKCDSSCTARVVED